MPQPGVYAGIAKLANGNQLQAVINLGVRPTVAANNALCLEAHILDFNQDIYGEKLGIEFWHKLREEKKFEAVESLKAQIMEDCGKARSYLSSEKSAFIGKQSLKLDHI